MALSAPVVACGESKLAAGLIPTCQRQDSPVVTVGADSGGAMMMPATAVITQRAIEPRNLYIKGTSWVLRYDDFAFRYADKLSVTNKTHCPGTARPSRGRCASVDTILLVISRTRKAVARVAFEELAGGS
jgi:hypothetical protein